MPSSSSIPEEIKKGIAYAAEQTHAANVIILIFSRNARAFIGYTTAKKRSIETTMTIDIEAGMGIRQEK